MQNKSENRILGVDPGYGRVGIAILDNEKGNQKLIFSECFETSKELPHPERLQLVVSRIKEILDEWMPTEMALETLLFSKNIKTAMQVAEARGAILAEGARNGITISEFNPNEIKVAVTGYGKSDKKQVIDMVDKILKPKNKIKYDDEYDAIAIALTCAVSKKFK